VDLADLREYQVHDDVRHIDWNVTARMGVPHVRVLHEDRDLTCWFLLDLSGSVDFGSGDVTKLALSAGFVAALARVLTRHGNRVGALLYGSHVDTVLPPGTSRRHVLDLLTRMRQPRPAPRAARPGTPAAGAPAAATGPRKGTELARLLGAAQAAMTRRSLVFVVSDFISEPGWEPVLARLAQRHEVVAVRLSDPAELALPDVGLVTVEDAETGEQLFVDSTDPAFRARYARIAAQREAELLQALAGCGVDTLELATDDDLLQALLRLCDLRRQRARLQAPLRFPRRCGAPSRPCRRRRRELPVAEPAVAAAARAAAGGAVPVAAAPASPLHRAPGQHRRGARGPGPRPGLAAPRAAAAAAGRADGAAVRGGAADGGGEPAAGAAHHHAGDGRLGLDARHRRQAQPHRRLRRRRPRPSSRSCRAT
jgi:hypothetical protein